MFRASRQITNCVSFGVRALAFVLLLAAYWIPVRVAHAQPNDEPIIYQYAVKVLCSPDFGSPTQGLIAARYMTSVTVHRPVDDFGNGNIVLWAIFTPSQGDGRRQHTMSLPASPFNATDLDCQFLADHFGTGGRLVPSGEGYLIIQSATVLDVSAVYTSEVIQNRQSKGVNIDIEVFEPTIIYDLPELVLSRVTPQVMCQNPAVSCTLTVNVAVANTSDTHINHAFDLSIRITGQPERVITVSRGLQAGSTTIYIETFTLDHALCQRQGCQLWVTVDSGRIVIEADESNNLYVAGI